MPTPQRVKEFLRHLVEKEEVKNNRPGILGPMAAMARKESLSDADKNFLVHYYNFSRRFLNTGKGYAYNRFHEDDRAVVDLSGEAYRSIVPPLSDAAVAVAEDIDTFLWFIEQDVKEGRLRAEEAEDLKDLLVPMRDLYDEFCAEMTGKMEHLDDERISTYSMSKATLVDYMFHAVKLLELYQMMFDYLASAGEPEDGEDETAGNGPEASLMAMLRHHKKTDLPN